MLNMCAEYEGIERGCCSLFCKSCLCFLCHFHAHEFFMHIKFTYTQALFINPQKKIFSIHIKIKLTMILILNISMPT